MAERINRYDRLLFRSEGKLGELNDALDSNFPASTPTERAQLDKVKSMVSSLRAELNGLLRMRAGDLSVGGAASALEAQGSNRRKGQKSRNDRCPNNL